LIEPPLSAPRRLAPDDDCAAFDSGVGPLDEWLKRRARHNDTHDASRTYVCCAGRRVVGFYSLAAGSVQHGVATGGVRRNMPQPIPIVLLGRLALDVGWQGRGIGADLLRDAVLRALAAGEAIGVRAILVHAILESARAFYVRHGFRASPVETLTLTLSEARHIVNDQPPV